MIEVVEDCDQAKLYEITIKADVTDEEENIILVDDYRKHCFVSYWRKKLEKIFENLDSEDEHDFIFRIYENDVYLFRDITDEFGMSVTDYIEGGNYTCIKYIKEVEINYEA